MLSATTRYALRALVLLGQQEGSGPLLGRELSARAGIPENYLSKVLVSLRNAGFVGATRGSGGGYCLKVPTREIPLIRVVEIFEGVDARPACLLGAERECSDDNPCSAHAAWRDVRRRYVDFLEGTTIADISDNGVFPSRQRGAGSRRRAKTAQKEGR